MELSGVIHVEIGGTVIPIPGFMVFVALAYSAIGTSLALWAGFPLVGASNLRQTVEANFRFGLARAREYSESIALIRGDTDERTHLQELLRGVRRGWERQTYGLVRIIVFTTAYGVLANPFPLLVAAPRYIMGLISLGTLMQMAQAFSQVTAALAFPVDNLSGIALWRASVERVMALQDALGGLEEKLGANRIEVKHEGNSLQLAGVRVMQHDGVPLMHEITAEIGPREHVLIEGDTQVCHKLILAVAGLWPWGAGKVTLPAGANIFIASDRPYLPVGALGEAVCYPMTLGVCVPDDINSALRRVGPGRLGRASWRGGELGARCSPWRNSKGSVLRACCFIGPTGFSWRRQQRMRSMQRPSVKWPSCWSRNFRRQRSWPLVELGLFDGFFQRVLHVEGRDRVRVIVTLMDGVASAKRVLRRILGSGPWDRLEPIVKLCRAPVPSALALPASFKWGVSTAAYQIEGLPQRTGADPASGTCSADRRAVLPMAIPAMWRATTTIAIGKTWR